MKKLSLNFMLLISLSVFSQTTTPFVIQHCKDVMTDNEYYFPEKKLICSNIEKTKGFTINPSFKSENGVMVNNGLDSYNVGIGNCDEDDTLIFLFEDDSKITLKSWNKFNCDGNGFYNLTEDDYKQLASKKIKTIRFTNGYTFDTFTYSLNDSQKDFLVRVYSNYKIVEVDCSK